MRFDSTQFARRKVGDEHHLFADKLFGSIVFGYSADNRTAADAVVDQESQKFVGLRNTLAFEHGAHAQVGFHEGVEVDIGLLRFGLPGFYSVFFLDALKTVGLCLDGVVLDFFEEQFGGFYRASRFHGVAAAYHVPAERAESEHG